MRKKDPKASVYITSEKLDFFVSETILGVIYLKIHSQLKPSKLFFRFIGKEIFTANNSRSVHYICKKQICLNSWSSTVSPEEFAFPFEFLLPDRVPCSFILEGGARITYYIKGVLVEGQTKKIARDKIEVQILPRYNLLVFSVHQGSTFPLKSCFCIPKGTVGLWAYMNKDAFYPTEAGQLIVNIENSQNSVSITGLKIHLVRLIHFKKSNKTTSEVLYKNQLKHLIPPHTNLLSEQAMTLDVPFYEIEHKIRWAGSTEGEMLSCRYFFKISVEFGALVRPKSLIVDFKVYPQPFENRDITQAFDEWSPHVMPKFNISLLNASEYGACAPYEEKV